MLSTRLMKTCSLSLLWGCLCLVGCDPDAPESAGNGGGAGHGGEGGGAGEGGTPMLPNPVAIGETLLVRDHQGNPVPDVTIVVNDAEGKLVRVGVPDADGQWVTDVPPNGSATAVCKPTSLSQGKIQVGHFLQTVTSIPKGATVVLYAPRYPPPVPENAPMNSLSIELKGPIPPGVAVTELTLSCSDKLNASAGVVVQGYKGCPGKKTYDVFVLAKAADGTAKAAGYLLDQPIMPGASITHGIELNTPLDGVYALTQEIPPGYGYAGLWLQGWRESDSSTGIAVGVSDSSPSQTIGETLRLPLAAVEGVQLCQYVHLNNAKTWDGLDFCRRFDAVTGPVAWSPTSLARFASSPVADLTEVAHPGVAWALTEDGDLGDIIDGSLVWSSPAPDVVSTRWEFSAPAARAGKLRLPDLPAEMVDWLPQPGDSVDTPEVTHRDRSTADGYVTYIRTVHGITWEPTSEVGDVREASRKSWVQP